MEWLKILQSEVARGKSKAQVGRDIGYSRPAVSLALKGEYPGGTTKIEAATLARYTNRLACPHLGISITLDECRDFAARIMPTSDARALKHWSACQRCSRKPANDDSENPNQRSA